MATLKAAIHAVLETDAKIDNPANLGGMLGMSGDAPYGVYFRNPPVGTDFESYSILTFFVNSMAKSGPAKTRDIYISFTAWGANYETILEQVGVLLEDVDLTGVTDYKPLQLQWDHAGPELFDEELRVYYQQHRFLAKAVKV